MLIFSNSPLVFKRFSWFSAIELVKYKLPWVSKTLAPILLSLRLPGTPSIILLEESYCWMSSLFSISKSPSKKLLTKTRLGLDGSMVTLESSLALFKSSTFIFIHPSSVRWLRPLEFKGKGFKN